MEEDNTTTDATTQDAGVDQTQPEEQQAEAVQDTTTSEPTTTDDQDGDASQEPAQSDNSTDDDVTAWAASKGIDLSTPEGQAKALKSWREAEKAMHAKSQKASELEKQLHQTPVDVDSDNPLVQELANKVVSMERTKAANDFKQAVNLTDTQEAKMVEYLTSNPSQRDLVNAGYLSLHDIYKLSGANDVDPDTLKQQGSQEALQKLANKQRAAVVSGAAVKNNPSPQVTAENVEDWWQSLGPEGRSDPANRKKLDSLLR